MIEYSYSHMIFADGYSLGCLLLSVTVASEGLSGPSTKNDKKRLAGKVTGSLGGGLSLPKVIRLVRLVGFTGAQW